MNLSDLAEVELQLCMRALHTIDVVSLARCSKRMFQAANHHFAWNPASTICVKACNAEKISIHFRVWATKSLWRFPFKIVELRETTFAEEEHIPNVVGIQSYWLQSSDDILSMLRRPQIQSQLHTLRYDCASNDTTTVPPEVATLPNLTDLYIRLNIDSNSTSFQLHNPALTKLHLSFGASAKWHHGTLSGTAPLQQLVMNSVWMQDELNPFFSSSIFAGLQSLTLKDADTHGSTLSTWTLVLLSSVPAAIPPYGITLMFGHTDNPQSKVDCTVAGFRESGGTISHELFSVN